MKKRRRKKKRKRRMDLLVNHEVVVLKLAQYSAVNSHLLLLHLFVDYKMHLAILEIK